MWYIVVLLFSDCGIGRFGEHCSHNCHCGDGLPCDKSSGRCQSPSCIDGWDGQACNDSTLI